MLDLIQREKIATTFFVSGIHAIHFPGTFKKIKEGGHEITAETYIHDYAYMKTMEQEWDGIKRSHEAIQQTTGERPLGYLSTGVTPSEFPAPPLAELGFSYWTDPRHDEIPYTLKAGGREITVLSYNNFVNDYTTLRA